MPRNRIRKTNIGLHTEEQMSNALKLISDGRTIRSVAKSTAIPYTTLYRYHVKSTKNPDPAKPVRLTPNYAVHKIFTDAEEKEIVDYIIKCSQMFYGLTVTDVRSLVYEVALLNNKKVPEKWHETKLAGVEYLYNLRKRDNRLSLRTPEGCSLSRATSFNRHNVGLFFDNLENVMSRQSVFGNGTRVFNLDETNTMTVQKNAKVLAAKGQRQVSKVTSAERGTLTTTCYIVSALGNALPPVMIFPRVHFKQHMIADAPAGTLGLANTSGWMNSELFVKTIQHFITHTNSSKDNPSLLIYDNHESHICIEALNLAKENGVTILTVPPHSTGKLQPLDVGVFGPFKTAYNKAVDSWMMRNPGKTFSIYEVASCVKEAHMKAMTPANICAAFKATGIFPFNRDVFTDLDFAPSEVTDRPIFEEQNENIRPLNPSSVVLTSPCPGTSQLIRSNENDAHDNDREIMKTPLPFVLQPPLTLTGNVPQTTEMPSSNSLSPIQNAPVHDKSPKATASIPSSTVAGTSTSIEKKFLSPFQLRGLPKAGPRKEGRAARRKGKSMIVTDTPNKDEIQMRGKQKIQKKQKQTKAAATSKKRKILQESSSDDEDQISIYSEEEAAFEDEEDNNMTIDPDNFPALKGLPVEGDFILVEFEVKRKRIFYAAKVIGQKQNETEVSFLRKSDKTPNNFHMPNVPDIGTVPLHDIKMILPKPTFSGTTKRKQGVYNFNVNLSNINLR